MKYYLIFIDLQAILAELRADCFLIKNKSQISNFLSQLKKSRYGSTKISLGNVEEWCNEHTRIPQNENEPYAAAYSVHYGDGDNEDDNNDSLITH